MVKGKGIRISEITHKSRADRPAISRRYARLPSLAGAAHLSSAIPSHASIDRGSQFHLSQNIVQTAHDSYTVHISCAFILFVRLIKSRLSSIMPPLTQSIEWIFKAASPNLKISFPNMSLTASGRKVSKGDSQPPPTVFLKSPIPSKTYMCLSRP